MNDYFIAKKYISMKESAEKRGITFDLPLQSLINIMKANKCFYTGVLLNDIENDPNKRTIDRIDNSKGYIKGNVAACSLSFNQRKGCITKEDVKILSRHLL